MKRNIQYFLVVILVLLAIKGVSQDTLTSENVEQKSYQLYLDKNWPELIKVSNKAIKNGYDYFYLQLRVGIAYYEQKNYSIAEGHFQKALSFNADDELSLEYLYYCYLFVGRNEEARWLSKKFSATLAEKIGTDRQSKIGFIALEGGSKFSNSNYFNTNYLGKSNKDFNPATYFQLGLNHFAKQRVSFYHSLTYYNQKSFVSTISQMQYYVKLSIPLKNNWIISPSAHILNVNSTPNVSAYSDLEQQLLQSQKPLQSQLQAIPQQQTQLINQHKIDSTIIRNINNWHFTHPGPLPVTKQDSLNKAVQSDMSIPPQLNQLHLDSVNLSQQVENYNSQIKQAQDNQKAVSTSKNYFIGSLSIQKTFKKAMFSIGTTISTIYNSTQYINYGLLAYNPLGNSRLVFGCFGYLNTINNYKVSYVSISPFVYFQPTTKLSIKLAYLNNGATSNSNIMEDNGYFVNNSKDLTKDRYSTLINYTLSKHIMLYGVYQLENKRESNYLYDYHNNVVVLGLKIIP